MKYGHLLQALSVCLLLGLMAVCMAGCGYTSPFTDHFVRFAESGKENRGELKAGWERYKKDETDRMPTRKIIPDY